MTSECEQAIHPDQPRLVVLFRRGHDGGEQFQWGVVGHMPILTLIGHIAQVQGELLRDEWMPEWDGEQPALVILWDVDDRVMSHRVHSDIPREPLVGMLETIKAMLVNSRLGQHSASQKVQLLGPDGTPMRG